MKHVLLAILLTLTPAASAAMTAPITPSYDCGPSCDGGDGPVITYTFVYDYVQSSSGQKREVCLWRRTQTSSGGSTSSPYTTTGAWVPWYALSVPACTKP